MIEAAAASAAWSQAGRTQLLQLISGLDDGVIIINPDQTIAWANNAALAMHGVQTIEALGDTVDTYRRRFILRAHAGDNAGAARSRSTRCCAARASTR